MLLAALLVPMAGGCQSPIIPDPNDPGDVGLVAPSVLKRNLKYASDFLFERVARHEITDERAHRLLAATARRMTAHVDVGKLAEAMDWEYGDVLATAERWDAAKAAYEIAVKHPGNEDRRINDTLGLARCEAMLGEVDEAIATASKVLDAKPHDSAPILPSVLLVLVPAVKGKGRDEALARLLEQAIAKHRVTIVDPKTEAGQMFLMARRYHIQHAWAVIAKLYTAAGKPALADKARQDEAKMMPELAVPYSAPPQNHPSVQRG